MWNLKSSCPSCPYFPSYWSQEISFYKQGARNKRPGLIFRYKAIYINSKKQGATKWSRICQLRLSRCEICCKLIVKLLLNAKESSWSAFKKTELFSVWCTANSRHNFRSSAMQNESNYLVIFAQKSPLEHNCIHSIVTDFYQDKL